MPKYLNDKNTRLDHDLYFEFLESKGVKSIRFRRTRDFSKVKGTTMEIVDEKIWSYGDTLFKISFEYYGTYDFWWCIALVNSKPTDSHFSIGDTVLIPADPSLIIEAMR